MRGNNIIVIDRYPCSLRRTNIGDVIPVLDDSLKFNFKYKIFLIHFIFLQIYEDNKSWILNMQKDDNNTVS